MKDWWKRKKVHDDLTLRVIALCLLYNWYNKFLKKNCDAALVGEYNSWFSVNKVENVDWPP